MKSALDLRVYLVADPAQTGCRTLEYIVEQALAGGVTIVQYRDKGIAKEDFLEKAGRILQITRRFSVPLIINDHVRIARVLGADGVHLGQDDLHPREAREILGVDKIIGVSVGNEKEAAAAQADGADYIGIGPVFQTNSKHDAGPPLGLDEVSRIAASVSIPAVAIGSVNRDNIKSVIDIGIQGAAVISAIMGAEDIKQSAGELLAAYGPG